MTQNQGGIMTDEKPSPESFEIDELDDNALEGVAGGDDVNLSCPNTNCAGANCIAGCGKDTEIE
jgi:hypothetical protein